MNGAECKWCGDCTHSSHNCPIHKGRLKDKEIEQLQAKNKMLADIVNGYHLQYDAAMRAHSLGLCKRVIKHAMEDEQELRTQNG